MMERERSVVPNSHFRLHSVHSDHWESLGCWLSISQNSFNWMVQLHPSTLPCHSPHPKHPKEKIDVDVLPSNLFAIKKNKRNSPLSVENYLPFDLSNSTVPQKMDEISGPATLNPPHPYNAADHTAEFPAQQRVFPMSDLGAVGLPGTGTVKLVIIVLILFFSNHPAVCGRVEFPPIPPPHLELYDIFPLGKLSVYIVYKSSLIPIHTAQDQYFMFGAGIGLSLQTTLS